VQYTISYSSEPKRLNQNLPFDSYLAQGQFQYFNFYFDNSTENIYIGLTNMNGDADMYLNRGTELPSMEKSHWRATDTNHEYIEISKDDPYFKTHKKPISGYYTLLLIGFVDTSYSLFISSHKNKVFPLRDNIVSTCWCEAKGEKCYFRYNDVFNRNNKENGIDHNEIVFTSEYLYGSGTMFSKNYIDKELYSSNEFYKNFPSKDDYDFSNKESNQRNYMKVKVQGEKYNKDSTVLLTFECNERTKVDITPTSLRHFTSVDYIPDNKENIYYLGVNDKDNKYTITYKDFPDVCPAFRTNVSLLGIPTNSNVYSQIDDSYITLNHGGIIKNKEVYRLRFYITYEECGMTLIKDMHISEFTKDVFIRPYDFPIQCPPYKSRIIVNEIPISSRLYSQINDSELININESIFNYGNNHPYNHKLYASCDVLENVNIRNEIVNDVNSIKIIPIAIFDFPYECSPYRVIIRLINMPNSTTFYYQINNTELKTFEQELQYANRYPYTLQIYLTNEITQRGIVKTITVNNSISINEINITKNDIPYKYFPYIINISSSPSLPHHTKLFYSLGSNKYEIDLNANLTIKDLSKFTVRIYLTYVECQQTLIKTITVKDRYENCIITPNEFPSKCLPYRVNLNYSSFPNSSTLYYQVNSSSSMYYIQNGGTITRNNPFDLKLYLTYKYCSNVFVKNLYIDNYYDTNIENDEFPIECKYRSQVRIDEIPENSIIYSNINDQGFIEINESVYNFTSFYSYTQKIYFSCDNYEKAILKDRDILYNNYMNILTVSSFDFPYECSPYRVIIRLINMPNSTTFYYQINNTELKTFEQELQYANRYPYTLQIYLTNEITQRGIVKTITVNNSISINEINITTNDIPDEYLPYKVNVSSSLLPNTSYNYLLYSINNMNYKKFESNSFILKNIQPFNIYIYANYSRCNVKILKNISINHYQYPNNVSITFQDFPDQCLPIKFRVFYLVSTQENAIVHYQINEQSIQVLNKSFEIIYMDPFRLRMYFTYKQSCNESLLFSEIIDSNSRDTFSFDYLFLKSYCPNEIYRSQIIFGNDLPQNLILKYRSYNNYIQIVNNNTIISEYIPFTLDLYALYMYCNNYNIKSTRINNPYAINYIIITNSTLSKCLNNDVNNNEEEKRIQTKNKNIILTFSIFT